MFKLDAFGNRILCRPRLVFNGPGAGGGGGDDVDESRTPQEQGYDFPASTPVADMTTDQKSEYYRFHARKHEQRVKSMPNYDKFKADSEELARVNAGKLTPDEIASQTALDEARREGENLGAEKYLVDAVKANFRASTKLTVAEVDAAFEHIDAKSFLDTAGSIDHTRLDAFAANYGGTPVPGGAKPPVIDPLRNALDRQRQAGGGAGGSSMKDLRDQTRESLSKSKK